jgi:hypothetical protein
VVPDHLASTAAVQKFVSKTILLSMNKPSILQVPWKLATGNPQAGRVGSGVPLMMSAGTLPGGKNHMRMKSEFHCVANTPPALSLKSTPYEVISVLSVVQPVAEPQSVEARVPVCPLPATVQVGLLKSDIASVAWLLIPEIMLISPELGKLGPEVKWPACIPQAPPGMLLISEIINPCVKDRFDVIFTVSLPVPKGSSNVVLSMPNRFTDGVLASVVIMKLSNAVVRSK